MAGLRSRLIGIVMIAFGAALGWYFGLKPLEEARAGAQEVSYSLKLFIAAPLAIVGGLFLLIGGTAVGEAFSGPPQGTRQHLIVWSAFAIAIVAGGCAWWWFDAQLSALGYRVG